VTAEDNELCPEDREIAFQPPMRRGVALVNCPECEVAPGENHAGNSCIWANCPHCGVVLPCSSCREKPLRPALWHGTTPELLLAAELGWLQPVDGDVVADAVRMATRCTAAIQLGMCAWDPTEQRYRAVGNVDDSVLDLHLGSPMPDGDLLGDQRDLINAADADDPLGATAAILDRQRQLLDELEMKRDS
jgi:hypothetical protein